MIKCIHGCEDSPYFGRGQQRRVQRNKVQNVKCKIKNAGIVIVAC